MSGIGATLEILARLIAFDTTSRRSNLALIDWVDNFLGERGVSARRVVSDDGAKANLYARIGPDAGGGVVLSGHTDVVPVDGQTWSSDPWTLTERDGRFYGRGAADMKSFLALALAHVDAAQDVSLLRPIVLAFSYDEEVGCLGAPSMIAELADFGMRPEAVIVGEPTSMRVVSAHKGVRTFWVEVSGREGHSSLPGAGVSAIAEAAKLMQFVYELAREAESMRRPHFDPPCPTLTIGRVEGGTASNILAGRCAFLFDLRSADVAEADTLEARFRERAAVLDAELKRRAPEAGVVVTRRSSTPELVMAETSAAETLARALTGDNEIRAVSYAAEAGLFQRAGMSAIVCGPGSIEQAHQPDEWIARAQIEAGAAFMTRLIARLSA